MPKLLIATPAHGETFYTPYVDSIFRLHRALIPAGWTLSFASISFRRHRREPQLPAHPLVRQDRRVAHPLRRRRHGVRALPKLLIATPAHGEVFYTPYVDLIFRLHRALPPAGWTLSFASISYADIAESRNFLLTHFFTRPTRRTSCSSTSTWTRAQLVQEMLALNKPVVGAVSPRRSIDLKRLAKIASEGDRGRAGDQPRARLRRADGARPHRRPQEGLHRGRWRRGGRAADPARRDRADAEEIAEPFRQGRAEDFAARAQSRPADPRLRPDHHRRGTPLRGFLVLPPLAQRVRRRDLGEHGPQDHPRRPASLRGPLCRRCGPAHRDRRNRAGERRRAVPAPARRRACARAGGTAVTAGKLTIDTKKAAKAKGKPVKH